VERSDRLESLLSISLLVVSLADLLEGLGLVLKLIEGEI
jgi:hypothetical protein